VEVEIRLACDGDTSLLIRVLELSMAPPCGHQAPAVSLYQLNDISDFQSAAPFNLACRRFQPHGFTYLYATAYIYSILARRSPEIDRLRQKPARRLGPHASEPSGRVSRRVSRLGPPGGEGARGAPSFGWRVPGASRRLDPGTGIGAGVLRRA